MGAKIKIPADLEVLTTDRARRMYKTLRFGGHTKVGAVARALVKIGVFAAIGKDTLAARIALVAAEGMADRILDVAFKEKDQPVVAPPAVKVIQPESVDTEPEIVATKDQ